VEQGVGSAPVCRYQLFERTELGIDKILTSQFDISVVNVSRELELEAITHVGSHEQGYGDTVYLYVSESENMRTHFVSDLLHRSFRLRPAT